MATEAEIIEESERTMLDLAMPLFNHHVAKVKRTIALAHQGYPGCRSAAMLHWASLQAVFGAHPDAKAILDAMLPAVKAPGAPAASPVLPAL